MISILKNNSSILRGLLTAVVVYTCFTTVVLAQGSVVLSVSPTQFKMTADPGQVWSSSLRVINGNQTDIPVFLSLALFTADGETGQPQFITPPADSSTLAQWITVSNEPVIVPAEQAVQIPFTISIPDDAPPGGQYAALFVGTQPPGGDPDATYVQTSQVIASLIFLQVSGDIIERGIIREFRTNQRVFDRPEASFVMRFENQGTVHLQPQGDITILNMWGEERGLVPINQRTFLGDVLPGQIRRFTFDWESEWSLTDLGLYTAIATVGYGADTKQFVTSRTTFWVVPWKIVLWVGAGILIFIWFISWAVKMYIRRMLALAGLAPTHDQMHVTTQTAPSITAPLEAGMLDLRQRLHESQSTASRPWVRTRVIGVFIFHYRIFFTVLLLILLSVSGVVWYFTHNAHMTRQFEVRVTERDIPVSFSNGRVNGTDLISETIPVTVHTAEIDSSYVEDVASRIRDAGYTVVFEPVLDMQGRASSVILHSAGYQSNALAISNLLGGILISQYEVSSERPAGIHIQLGTDISTHQE